MISIFSMITTHNNGKGVKNMSQNKEKNKQSESKKTAYNNQWTNNNLKYYPDERKRQDGPGGN